MRKVLIVEHDLVLFETLCYAFRAYHLFDEFYHALSFKIASMRLRENDPEFILIDLMPGGEIPTDILSSGKKILLLSTSSKKEDLALLNLPYLQMPFDIDALINKIKHFST